MHPKTSVSLSGVPIYWQQQVIHCYQKEPSVLKWWAALQCLPGWGQKYPIDGSKCWQGDKYRYDPCHKTVKVVSKCLWKQQNNDDNVALLCTCQFRCWKGASQEQNSDFDFSQLLNVYISPLHHCYQHLYYSLYFIQLKQYHYHITEWDQSLFLPQRLLLNPELRRQRA